MSVGVKYLKAEDKRCAAGLRHNIRSLRAWPRLRFTGALVRRVLEIVLDEHASVLETVAVHHYSSSLDGGVGGFIGLFYALLTLLISSQQAAVPRAVYHETAETLLPVGVALFIAGEVGNLYHHVLLAQSSLRSRR